MENLNYRGDKEQMPAETDKEREPLSLFVAPDRENE